jgi:threonyl-tRNA synthetase
MAMPDRFNLSYVDKDNQKKRPLMIHRTICGSIERFLGILIEHFAGRFPLWMAPIQVALLAINDELVAYADEIKRVFDRAGLRTEVDGRAESLNKKIRDAQLNKIPLILTIGGKEKESGTVSVRTLDGKVKYGISQQDFLDRVLSHIAQRKLELDVF